MEFSRQECWNGLPLTSPVDLPDPGIEPGYPALISHTSKVMLKILQVRLQQYVNCELPDVQAGF